MADTEQADKPLEEVILAGSDATKPAAPETPAAKRDASGRFAREEAEEAALTRIFNTNKLGDQPKEQPAAEAGKTEQKQDTGTKVPKALELDGFTSEDLQGLSPERITALEQKAAKRQSDIGKKLSERPKAETTATTTPDAPKAAAKPAQTYKDLVKSVGELLGDDVGEALSGVLEKTLSPLTERLNRAESLLQQRLETEMETQITSLRGKLAADFPSLKEDEALKRVVDRMGQLADPSRYSNLEDVMVDACRLELFADVQKPKTSTSRNDTSRNNGQPMTPTRTSKPSAAKTHAELEDEALDAAFKKNGISR